MSSFFTMIFDPVQFQRMVDQTVKAYLTAAKESVSETTREAELALEAATSAAGLGKLHRAWASKTYPKNGLAYNPSGLIYLKGGDRTQGAFTAFTQGTTISSNGGKFLAIPLPSAGRAARGRTMTVAAWVAKHGPLVFIPARGGKPAYLGTQGTTNARTGRFRAATARRVASGRAIAIIPIFVLLPNVSLAKRFDVRSVVRRYESVLANRFAAKVQAVTNNTP